MARIETTYAEQRIHERMRELLADYSDELAQDPAPAVRRRRASIVGEAEGLCFALGLMTGEDAASLLDRLWIEGKA